MRGHFLSLVLVGCLATPAVLAQQADEGGGRKGRRAGRRARGPQDPLTNFNRLSKQLSLDAGQQQQIKPLIEEYTHCREQVIAKTPQDVRERDRDLRKEMAEARKDKDKEKIEDLRKQRQELRKTDPTAQEVTKLRQELVDKIEPLLRDDQKERLRKLARMPGKPSLKNLGFLRRCVMELELRPDQRAELKKIEKEYGEATKELGKDAAPEKRQELSKQCCEEIMKILDAGQKQQLDQIAKKMPAKPSPLTRSAKALGKALESIELRPDQQTSIDALKERYQDDRRAAGKDRRAQMQLNRKLVEDVMKLLDDDQKEQLAKWRPAKRPGGKGRKKDKS